MNMYSLVADHYAQGGGIFSVCSAHPGVIEAALRHAVKRGSMVLIEATANQVDQYGGYTGMIPVRFREYVERTAKECGLPCDRLILGGDHLGPLRWCTESAQSAMDKAETLVRACAEAGFSKIHLDCSMACADDPGPVPDPEAVAQRAARLCKAAEESAAAEGWPAPVYIIGTEVPIPGGATHDLLEGLAVTRVDDARNTLEMHRRAFAREGLEDAFARVVGLVVQPGVEFAHASVVDYNPEAASELSCFAKECGMVFEAHSTDYQTPEALKQLVRDHFAILKVGPWLTWAWRQGLFALEGMEQELVAPEKCSRLSATLDAIMCAEPRYWQTHYHGSELEQRLARRYSFSDRARYYWPELTLIAAELRLLANLRNVPGGIPLPVLSQYMPLQYERVRACEHVHKNRGYSADPRDLLYAAVDSVLEAYAQACLEQ